MNTNQKIEKIAKVLTNQSDDFVSVISDLTPIYEDLRDFTEVLSIPTAFINKIKWEYNKNIFFTETSKNERFLSIFLRRNRSYHTYLIYHPYFCIRTRDLSYDEIIELINLLNKTDYITLFYLDQVRARGERYPFILSGRYLLGYLRLLNNEMNFIEKYNIIKDTSIDIPLSDMNHCQLIERINDVIIKISVMEKACFISLEQIFDGSVLFKDAVHIKLDADGSDTFNCWDGKIIFRFDQKFINRYVDFGSIIKLIKLRFWAEILYIINQICEK